MRRRFTATAAMLWKRRKKAISVPTYEKWVAFKDTAHCDFNRQHQRLMDFAGGETRMFTLWEEYSDEWWLNREKALRKNEPAGLIDVSLIRRFVLPPFVRTEVLPTTRRKSLGRFAIRREAPLPFKSSWAKAMEKMFDDGEERFSPFRRQKDVTKCRQTLLADEMKRKREEEEERQRKIVSDSVANADKMLQLIKAL